METKLRHCQHYDDDKKPVPNDDVDDEYVNDDDDNDDDYDDTTCPTPCSPVQVPPKAMACLQNIHLDSNKIIFI